MTDKVTLANLTSIQNDPTAVTTINANMAAITTAMDNTLSRDGTSPNQMGSSLDMNSFQILNLPTAATADSPLRLQDLSTFVGGGTVTNIPAGGATGSILAKNSGTDYDVHWITEAADLVAGTNITLSGTSPTTISLVSAPTTLGTNITGTSAGLTAGNVTTNANLTGVITSVGNATSIASQTGTGTKFVVDTSPTLVTPILGTPTSGTLTNCTIPASGITGTTLASSVITSSLTSFGASIALGTPASGTLTNCTIPASAITGTTLASSVVTSSLTSFGASIALGTPASGTLTNCTLPASAITGTTLASGVTASSLTSFGASIVLGTPASGTLTNCTIPGTALSGTTVGGASSTTLASTIVSSSLTSFGAGINVTNATNLLVNQSVGSFGYATGAGGTVTQITSRTTAVTLNKPTGAITLFAAAPVVGTWVSFTVNCSSVAVTDTVIIAFKSGTNTYVGNVSSVASGSFQISFMSIAGTASDSPVINITVFKGVTS